MSVSHNSHPKRSQELELLRVDRLWGRESHHHGTAEFLLAGEFAQNLISFGNWNNVYLVRLLGE